VKGTNTDSWTGLSGTQTSSKIYHQVTYTLFCNGYNGAIVDESRTVNVAPVYQEQ
jgi:hypothetical protein